MLACFVTGTDTDVGKTAFGCALLRGAAARGHTTAAMKAIETGCRRDGARLVARDAEALRSASTLADAIDDATSCPYRFEPPVAPSVAARAVEVAIDRRVIAAAHARLVGLDPGLLLVEGAGGLLVPIGDAFTVADLAGHLGLPLVIVARDRLGAINHASLTVEVARARGLQVAAVVLMAVDEREAVPGNLEALRRAGVPVVGRIGEHEGGVIPADAPAIAAVLDALADGRATGP